MSSLTLPRVKIAYLRVLTLPSIRFNTTHDMPLFAPLYELPDFTNISYFGKQQSWMRQIKNVPNTSKCERL